MLAGTLGLISVKSVLTLPVGQHGCLLYFFLFVFVKIHAEGKGEGVWHHTPRHAAPRSSGRCRLWKGVWESVRVGATEDVFDTAGVTSVCFHRLGHHTYK